MPDPIVTVTAKPSFNFHIPVKGEGFDTFFDFKIEGATQEEAARRCVVMLEQALDAMRRQG